MRRRLNVAGVTAGEEPCDREGPRCYMPTPWPITRARFRGSCQEVDARSTTMAEVSRMMTDEVVSYFLEGRGQ
jgi:hypothetical protein